MASKPIKGFTFRIVAIVGLFGVGLMTVSSGHAQSATSPDIVWIDLDRNDLAARGQPATKSGTYRSVAAALPELRARLASAPPEKHPTGGALLSLPMPDGSFQDFLVENSPIMEHGLATRYPQISTYVAVAVDDPSKTARLDLTPAGFHAIVFSTAGTVYIDPYRPGNDREYISYYKHSYSADREPWSCGVTSEGVDPAIRLMRSAALPVGDILRTYRLAVAATGEYTSFHGGTVASGLAAVVTAINRVSGIYERELSIRLSLVANNDLLIFTNPATDGYTNVDGFTMLFQNQAKLDTIIGTANYDIGHVFSTGGGGIAGLGVVCLAAQKAHGVSGVSVPIGDSFYVDIVAHEIGHQFGGNHTFNGSSGSCSSGGRNASSAYEPGSGSTILSYAGICAPQNIQSSHDDVFHSKSFDEIVEFITTDGASCGTVLATGNTAPTVDAGANFTVPTNTPLLLTADDAIDPDNGQVLTYSWEQFDLGAPSPPDSDDGSRPIFRSFPPSDRPIRFLPQMSDILNGVSTLGESLPTTERTLTFRLTARDNASGGGGVDYDTVAHQTSTTAGPFVVTSQNTPTNWDAGSLQSVTWDVANTTASPVNCATVDILYSDQEFADFPGATLLSATANDGSVGVMAPLWATSAGRIMAICPANNFFDVNDAPITVDSPCTTSDGDSATMAEPVDAELTCAARLFIDVEGATQVSSPNGHLYLIAPTIAFESGFSVAGELTVISDDPCLGCAPPL